MSFFTVLVGSGTEGNPQSGKETVASTATATISFLNPVNHVEIRANTDTEILVKWGAATDASTGSAATPKRQASAFVGPSYPPLYLASQRGYTALHVKNVGASSTDLVFNAWGGLTS